MTQGNLIIAIVLTAFGLSGPIATGASANELTAGPAEPVHAILPDGNGNFLCKGEKSCSALKAFCGEAGGDYTPADEYGKCDMPDENRAGIDDIQLPEPEGDRWLADRSAEAASSHVGRDIPTVRLAPRVVPPPRPYPTPTEKVLLK